MTEEQLYRFLNHEVVGVRYNVVRRPLSGGKGSITPHKAKSKQARVSKKDGRILEEGYSIPAETDAQFYERLRRDYIAAEPDYWFFRVLSRVSAADIGAFRRTCLDPVLENLADDWQWWEWCLRKGHDHWDYTTRSNVFPAHDRRHYRMPFGTYNQVTEAGATEYDEFMDCGSEAGLRRADKLFTELEDE